MKYSGIELVEKLSLLFAPSGCEDDVAAFILEQISDTGCEVERDRLGNVIARVGRKGGKKLMISAHMDEVGFMITEICEDGMLKFGTLGGIETQVMTGKRITVRGRDKDICGAICTKAIHHKKRDERLNKIPTESLYIDIGVSSSEEAQKLVCIGDCATFDSAFIRFGSQERKIKGKALDDRLGCALLIEVLRNIAPYDALPYDIYFCFTVREEIGVSGAQVAAQTIRPDVAIVIETTAIGDIDKASDKDKVAIQGMGGALSLMDRSTIYDRALVDAAQDIAHEQDIPVQIKKYVSGGNDASHIHKAACGVRTLALSAPTRYLHSPACVADINDYFAMLSLVSALCKSEKFTERKE